jgi:hypothetical protein
MEPKMARILKPCVENAIQIGNVIMAIEAVSRQPQGPLQASVLRTLEEELAGLQNEYSSSCMGKGLHQV